MRQQRRAQLAREACSASCWLWARLSTGDGGCPPCFSHGAIFGSPSRLAVPRPRELSGSKKAPRQSREAESWHVPFTKVALSCHERLGFVDGEGREAEQVHLRGGWAPGTAASAGRALRAQAGSQEGGRLAKLGAWTEQPPQVKSSGSRYS